MMTGCDLSPLQLYLNYWEIPPTKLGATLDHLQRLNVSEVTVFVPWQHFEKDLTHRVFKLLNGAIERKIRMNFIVSPEAGVHYPYAGVPKELALNAEYWIRDSEGYEVSSVLPPVMHAIPDLSHPDVQKRYTAFLEKFHRLVLESIRNRPDAGALFRVWCGGAFWKYHRSIVVSSKQGMGGLFTEALPALAKGPGGNEKQRFLDRYYSSSEFEEPSRSQAPKWRGITEEERNERLYQAHLEDAFRSKAQAACTRRTSSVAFEQVELIAPEADPSLAVLSIQGQGPTAQELSALLDAHLARSNRRAVIHWTSCGSFQGLPETEKQFLILRSIVEAGHRGGAVLLDVNAWMKLNRGFRDRIRRLANGIFQSSARPRIHASLYCDHLYAHQGLAQAFSRTLGGALQVTRSISEWERMRETPLFILDQEAFLTRDRVQAILECLERGAVVAVSQRALKTYSASLLLRSSLKDSKTWSYRQGCEAFITHVAKPSATVAKPPGTAAKTGAPVASPGILVQYSADAEQYASLAQLLLRISEWNCDVESSNASSFVTELRGAEPLEKGLVLANASANPTRVSLGWEARVQVGDLAAEWLGKNPSDERLQPSQAFEPKERLELDLPPWGVVPLHIIEERAEHGLAVRLEKPSERVSTPGVRTRGLE